MGRGAMVKVERLTTQKEVKCTSERNYSNLIEILKQNAELLLLFFSN